MAHNGWPFRFKPGLPIFAQHIDSIKENWKMLIDKGVTFVCPGHGKAFPTEPEHQGRSLANIIYRFLVSSFPLKSILKFSMEIYCLLVYSIIL